MVRQFMYGNVRNLSVLYMSTHVYYISGHEISKIKSEMGWCVMTRTQVHSFQRNFNNGLSMGGFNTSSPPRHEQDPRRISRETDVFFIWGCSGAGGGGHGRARTPIGDLQSRTAACELPGTW